ncbi:unannotated protein [freshwater metagenome]|uniref:Unannotated protein n=1 Tax=freshwater metagenome TaxID=449393 RepID=A0A6J7H2F0_9ZZZZ
MEADLDRELLEDGCEHRAAALLGIALTFFPSRDLLALLLHASQLSRRAGQHDAATTVADGQSSGAFGCSRYLELVDDRLKTFGLDVADRDHRRTVTGTDDAAATSDESGSSTDQLRDGQEVGVLCAVRGDGLGGDEALRVSDHLDRRGLGGVEALQLQRAQRGDLSEEDARQRHRSRGQCRFGGPVGAGGVVVGEVLLEHPTDRVEADRADDQQLVGHGREYCCGLVDEIGQFGLECGIARELFERTQPGRTLTTERQGVRLARGESICQSPRAATASRGFACVACASRAASV